MTTMETEKFLTEIKENEEYAIRVAQATAPEELAGLFREIGIQITTEEAADLMAQAKEKLDSCELDEEMLDAVNGGIGYLLGCIAFGAGAGVVLGLCAVGIYYLYKKHIG